jgi:hypothetical protein
MYLHLAATVHLLGLHLSDRAADRVRSVRRPDPQSGQVTVENVIWTVAVIGIVGIVVAAVKTFVQREANRITGTG